MPMMAWSAKGSHGRFAVMRATLGESNLSILRVRGMYRWLVRRDDLDVAEGVAGDLAEAKRAAEAAANALPGPQRR
jgi:hypothetical protein